MLAPAGLLFLGKELWSLPDDRRKLWMHLSFSDCHEAVVRDFQIGLPVLYRLCRSDTDQSPVIEVGRVFLTREFNPDICAPLKERFAIQILLIVLIEVALVILRV